MARYGKTRMEILKLIGQVCAVIGVIFLFFDNLYAPDALILSSSPSRPFWLSWASWGITALGTIVYIVADRLSARKSKVQIQTEQQHHPTNEQQE